MGLLMPQFQLKHQKNENKTMGGQHIALSSKVLEHLRMV